MYTPNTATKTPLQALTTALLVTLTESSPIKLEIAHKDIGNISQNISKEELEFAREMSEALVCSIKTCHFGITPDGKCSIFLENDQLEKYLLKTKSARKATPQEALDDALKMAGKIEYL